MNGIAQKIATKLHYNSLFFISSRKTTNKKMLMIE